MPAPYCYDHPRPAVTVDIVLFARGDDGHPRHRSVLLVRRKQDPFAGHWALPGGYVNIDEPIEAAVRRELEEETAIDYTGPLGLIGVFGDPDRDPRGRVISVAYAAILPGAAIPPDGRDDAEEARWFPTAEVEHLAFDHDLILTEALNWLETTWQ